jgi:hypothetical protein
MKREDEIRKEILFQAYARRPLLVCASAIYKQCRKEQMDFTETEIKRELPFLAGDELLKPAIAEGVTERHYEITSKGVRHYEQNYAA